MIARLVGWFLNAPGWALAAVGALALLLAGAGRHAAAAAAGAAPRSRPPAARSISAPCPRSSGSRPATAPRSASATIPRAAPATGRTAIVVHGSSGSSGGTIHALSEALAAHGVETYALDIRGHGASGTRGDIGYVGQLEDDLADFVAVVRKTTPARR